MFTSAEKPFQTAGKGTVQRRATMDSYAEEIEDLYGDFENITKLPKRNAQLHRSSPGLSRVSVGGFSHGATMKEWLQGLIYKVTKWSQLDMNANFFSLGMDSLQVINFVRAINAAIPMIEYPVTIATIKKVYANSTITMLAMALVGRIPQNSDSLDEDLKSQTGEPEMQRLVCKYS